MARTNAILQSEFPYSITARCINRDWFQLPMEDVWEIFSDELNQAHRDHELLIHVFVLMSNHFHLIASTPRSNISTCMHQLMHRSSRRLTKRGNRINQTFAGRHYKCVMQTMNYFLNAYKYVYRNPVNAGACRRVEDYPYSTIQQVLGRTTLLFPIVEDTLYLEDPLQTICWLNTAPDPAKLDAFRCGQRRQFFKSKKSPTSRKEILGPDELL